MEKQLENKDPFSSSFLSPHEWVKAYEASTGVAIEGHKVKFFQSPDGREIVMHEGSDGQFHLLSREDNNTRYLQSFSDGIEALNYAKEFLGVENL